MIDEAPNVSGVLLASLALDRAAGFIASAGLPEGTVLVVLHAREAQQSDDITVLALRYAPPPA